MPESASELRTTYRTIMRNLSDAMLDEAIWAYQHTTWDRRTLAYRIGSQAALAEWNFRADRRHLDGSAATLSPSLWNGTR